MTGTTPGQPPRDLPARLSRALYSEAGLRTPGAAHVAVPKGTLWYAGDSLGEIARQISSALPPGPAPDLCDQARPGQG